MKRGFTVLCLVLALNGCRLEFRSGGDDDPPPAAKYEWQALGELNLNVEANQYEAKQNALALAGQQVFIGTNDGVYQGSLAGGNWQKRGLNDVDVTVVKRHPTLSNVLFAAGYPKTANARAFYRSDNGGLNWTPTTTRLGTGGQTLGFYDLVIKNGEPNTLYANTEGSDSLAVSTDGGLSWVLANGAHDPHFGYPCVITQLPAQPGELWQGCEAPLDVAWLGRYRLNSAMPMHPGAPGVIVGGPERKLLDLQNRRPNTLRTSTARPDTVYAGLEGGVITLKNGQEAQWLYQAPMSGSLQDYVYVKGIWTAPNDRERVVFGGMVSGLATDFPLFDTQDHGRRVQRIPAPTTLNNPSVEALEALDDKNLLVLLSHTVSGKRQMRLYKLGLR